jgi:hypothetical protein
MIGGSVPIAVAGVDVGLKTDVDYLVFPVEGHRSVF